MDSDPVEDILKRVERVKKNGQGWMVRCPAHNDDENSLKVDRGQDGRALLKCHAGCDTADIVQRLGLSMADLFPRPVQIPRIVKTYDYCDAGGHLLFQSVRKEPKDFSQRRPLNGDWVWNLKDTPRVLYRLPELLQANPIRTVFIVEGEKDVDRLIEAGFIATTNPQGAGKWRDEFSTVLEGRAVAIIPDNDEPGRKHAAQVALSLAGKAASIKVIDLPGLPEKGDVSDWFEGGMTKADLKRLTLDTPMLLIDDQGDPLSENMSILDFSRASKAKMSILDDGLVKLEDVIPEQVSWLWQGRIPYGKLTVLDGDPGLGKSTMLLDIAARLTTGTPMPGEKVRPEKASVLLLSAEDGLGDTVRPRLEAAGADLTRVRARTIVRDIKGDRLPELGGDLATIELDIQSIGARLVVIDPLMAYLGDNANSNNDQDIRRTLAPVAALAERTGAAIVIIRHLNKASGGNAIYRGGGSIGIIAAARSGLLVAKDTDDPTETRRILASTKCNLAPPPPSFAYRFMPAPNGVACIQWEGETNHTATSLLAGPIDQSEKPAIAEASRFLRDMLEDTSKGVTEIKREARQAGISDITLRRAKDILGVVARREGFGSSGFWVWEFPDTDEHLSIDAHENPKVLTVLDTGSPMNTLVEDDAGDWTISDDPA